MTEKTNRETESLISRGDAMHKTAGGMFSLAVMAQLADSIRLASVAPTQNYWEETDITSVDYTNADLNDCHADISSTLNYYICWSPTQMIKRLCFFVKFKSTY